MVVNIKGNGKMAYNKGKEHFCNQMAISMKGSLKMEWNVGLED